MSGECVEDKSRMKKDILFWAYSSNIVKDLQIRKFSTPKALHQATLTTVGLGIELFPPKTT